MPVIIDGTLGVNAAAVTTTNWNPTNLSIPGNATIGDASSDTLTINGASVTLAGTATRIIGLFDGSSQSNRVLFKTSSVNQGTTIGAIPNGTASIAQINLYSAEDADNSSLGQIRISSTEFAINASKFGTGSYQPITMWTGGSERVNISTSGNVGIGIAPSYKLDVSSPGFPVARLNSTYSSGGKTFSSLIMGTTTGNSGAQFGFVLNEATPANSFAHITYYGTGEGTGLAVGSTGVGVGGDGSIRGKFSVLTSGSFNAVGDSVNVGANFVGPNYDFNSSGNPTLLNIESNTAAGINVGATIGLGGQYNTATQKAQFAIIKAAKENATNDNYATYLAFGTRAHGANIQERMRIDSAGKVGIGKNNPGTTLDVAGTIQAVHSLGGALGIRIAADSTNAKGALQFTNNAANTDWTYLEAKSATHTTWRISNGSDTNSDYAAFGINGGPVSIRDITSAGGEASDWPVPSLSIASYDGYTANTMLAFMLKDDVNYMTDLSKWNFRLYHGAGQTTSDASTALGLGGPGNLYLQANGAGGIQLTTSGIERVRIASNGNTMVGTTSPLTTLTVNGYVSQWGLSGGRSQRIAEFIPIGTNTTKTITLYLNDAVYELIDIRLSGYAGAGAGACNTLWMCGGHTGNGSVFNIQTMFNYNFGSMVVSGLTRNSATLTFTVQNTSTTQGANVCLLIDQVCANGLLYVGVA